MQLYMITNRHIFASDTDQAALIAQALPWIRAGLNFIQVREKDLPLSELDQITTHLRDSLAARAASTGLPSPAVLINAGDRQQIKVACRVADGIHLPGDTRPFATRVNEARALWLAERPGQPPVISVSCHTVAEVEEARMAGVSAILFAPVFEKPIWEDAGAEQHRAPASSGLRLGSFPAAQLKATLPGVGLAALRAACAAAGPVPVFALGGVTLENAADCLAAGATGIAGIRLFAGEGWRRLIAH